MKIVALSVVLVLAVFFDLLERRIPNYLILAGLSAGLLLAIPEGWGGAGRFLGGALAGMALFFPFFALRLVGAGDLKLFGVVGGLAGWDSLLALWLYTLLAGGVLGIVSIVLGRSVRQCWQNMRLLLVSAIYRVEGAGLSLKEVASQTSARIPYAVAIAAGSAIWMVRQ